MQSEHTLMNYTQSGAEMGSMQPAISNIAQHGSRMHSRLERRFSESEYWGQAKHDTQPLSLKDGGVNVSCTSNLAHLIVHDPSTSYSCSLSLGTSWSAAFHAVQDIPECTLSEAVRQASAAPLAPANYLQVSLACLRPFGCPCTVSRCTYHLQWSK